jgi:hypothetical protein
MFDPQKRESAMSFQRYISEVRLGICPAGHLVDEFRCDRNFPNVTSWNDLETYLCANKADQAVISTAHIVWRDYEARQGQGHRRIPLRSFRHG